MSNQVEYGIRINVSGNRAAVDAIDQVEAAHDRLGAAAGRVGAAMQDMQAHQGAGTAAMTGTASASRSAASAIDQVALADTNLSAAAHSVAQAQTQQAASAAALQATHQSLNGTLGAQAAQFGNMVGGHQAVQQATRNTAGATQQLGVSQAQLNNAMRQVPAQFTDIVTSLQGGQAPLTVLLQQGGQLRDSFGSIGAAARGLGSYILGLIGPWTIAAAVAATLAIAYNAGANEAEGYARALALTGNAAGATVAQMSDVAHEIGQVTGSQHAAAEAITALVSTGQVSIDNLRQFGTVAVEVERDVGRSIADTASDFAALGKAPLAALDQINEKYHFITAATFDQVKALQDQGKAAEAADVAQRAYAEGIDKQRQKVLDSLTDWERGWIRIKNAASGAADAAIDFAMGREKGNAEKIGTLLDARAKIEENRRRARERGLARDVAIYDAELDLNQRQINAIRGRADAETATAKAEEKTAQAAAARKKWNEDSGKYLSRTQQRDRELEKAQNEGVAAGVSQEAINARLAAIRKQYADVNNVTLAGIEAQRTLEKEQTATSLAELESRHKRQLVNDVEYVTQKRDLQLQDLQGDIDVARKRAALAAGVNDIAERNKYLAQVKVLEEKRRATIKEADNALAESAFAATKAISDQVKTWGNATATERSALADEAELFGQSAEARKIAAEQLKVDAELRQFVTKLQSQGHVFTEQETADLKKAATARKDNIATIMGQRQALAGAEQLRQENLKFAANAIADEETRAARLLEIDADLWRERIKLAGDGTVAQKRLQEQFDQWYANRQLTPVLDRWKGIINNLDNDFREGFRDMLEHGHDAWKSFATSIGNTLKTSLATALYDTFIKKYVVQIVTSFAGAISGPAITSALGGQGVPAAGGAGGVSSAIGAAQAASNIYKVLSSGFENVGASFAGSIGSLGTTLGSNALQSFAHGLAGFSPTGAGAEALGVNSTWATAGSYAGTAANYGAGMLAGHYIGNAIAGDYSVNHGQAVTNTATIVGAIIGGPIGGAIGGAVGGLINRAFGMGSKEITTTGISGTLSSRGTTASSYSKWHQDGGWFRSDKNGTDSTAFSSNTIAALTNGLGQLKAVSSSFAASLGVEASSIENYTKAFNIDLGKDGKIEDGIAQLLTTVGDELATTLVPNIMQFARTGETASATLERLAGDFQATTQTAQLLGKTATEAFGSAGIESAAAREHLVELAGSASNLTAMASTYAQNFLTEAQRLAPVRQAVDEAMSSLGLAWVTTREQFKQVVDSLDLTTVAGAQQFTSMMQLADAFAQVHAASDALAKSETQIADERKSLQSQLDDMTMTSAQLLEKQRAALDESNRGLFDQVQAAKKVKEAQDAAKTSLGNFLSQMKSFAETSAGLNNSLVLSGLSTLTPEQQYAEARRQFEQTRQKAAAGDATAQGNLQSVEQAFLQLSQKINGGDAQYSSDLATVMRTNDDLAKWAIDSVDVAQASLDALNDQSSTLTDISSILTDIAQGVQYLPAALTGQDVESFVQEYTPVDYAPLDAVSIEPLVEEMKAIRNLVENVLTETKGRREDAKQQTGDLINANEAIAERAADKMVDGMRDAVTDAAYAEANSTREPK